MALILNLETSSDICSVALAKDGVVLQIKESGGQNHAAMLTPFIEEVMLRADQSLSDIDAVALSEGPGSYTGLRIGAATAKGICYSLSKPLIAVDSLQILAIAMKANEKQINMVYCPTIDARRNEIYYSLYDEYLKLLIPSTNIILSNSFLNDYSRVECVVIAGSGAEKTVPFLSHFKKIIKIHVDASARWMPHLSEMKWAQQQTENVEQFEPKYLKPVFITKPK